MDVQQQRDEAQRTLRTIHDAEQIIADRAHWPIGYHAVCALLVGLMVAMPGLPRELRGMAPIAIVFGALALKTWSDKRHGFIISGWRRGRTLPISIGLVGVIGVGLVCGLLAKLRYGVWWPFLPIGLTVGIATFFISLMWERALHADMERRRG